MPNACFEHYSNIVVLFFDWKWLAIPSVPVVKVKLFLSVGTPSNTTNVAASLKFTSGLSNIVVSVATLSPATLPTGLLAIFDSGAFFEGQHRLLPVQHTPVPAFVS
ncbi:hypothetical protein ACLOAU_19200 [Niabella sp. CJ426]|uniref:hypothetical protein n=1 Tax=Niabella sp. CJ426 TaxID=3393740 RepID=UPI003CFC0A0A